MADLGRVADAFQAHGARHRFYDDPVGFAEHCIRWPKGESLTAYQAEILGALPARRRVSGRGPHGLGKTTTAALAVLWFASTRELSERDWKIPTTAGAWRQLTVYLWPEIRKWARRLNWEAVGCAPWSTRDELLALTLKLRFGSAFAVASDNPALIEGAHADSILYLFDEAKSIPAGTFDAAEGALGGQGEALALALSTPGEPAGRFYDIHARRPGLEDWWARHVTVDDAAAAGRISPRWVEQRRRQWGESSSIFQNRVLGEFASSDEDSVVPLGWVEAAQERWRAWDDAGRPTLEGRRTVGVDVARSGADRTVLAIADGPVVVELRRSALEDTMQTTGRVRACLNASPDRLPVVDVIGVGGGVVDRLRELGVQLEPFNAAEKTERRDRSRELGFVNCRAAAWWHLRELLDPAFAPAVCLPPDDQLTGDLTAPRWKVTSEGRIQVESKDDIRKRIGRSTDDADAVIMALWLWGGAVSASFDAAMALVTAQVRARARAADRDPAPPDLGPVSEVTDEERRRAARVVTLDRDLLRRGSGR